MKAKIMRSTARCLAASACVAVLLPWHGHGAEPEKPSLTDFGPCFEIGNPISPPSGPATNSITGLHLNF